MPKRRTGASFHRNRADVNDFLMKGFPDLINVDFTSHMEEGLDEVEEGNKRG